MLLESFAKILENRMSCSKALLEVVEEALGVVVWIAVGDYLVAKLLLHDLGDVRVSISCNGFDQRTTLLMSGIISLSSVQQSTNAYLEVGKKLSGGHALC
jgi:hypothetical protein